MLSLGEPTFKKKLFLSFFLTFFRFVQGREEKGCLLSTEKKAAVDVDQLKKAGCTFQLVDVNSQRQPNKKNVFFNSEVMKFFLFF